MSEILGTIASGIAVVQLASELVVKAQKLYAFWIGIRDAPKQVGDALREIQLLGKIFGRLRFDEEDGLGEDKEAVILDALSYCREVMEEFGVVLNKSAWIQLLLEGRKGIGLP